MIISTLFLPLSKDVGLTLHQDSEDDAVNSTFESISIVIELPAAVDSI